MSLLGLGAVAAVILTWKTLGASPTPTAHVYRLFPLERICTLALASQGAEPVGLAAGLVWPAAAMYYAGAPLIGPAVETLLLKSRANRGAVVGMQSSVATVCR